MRRTSDRLSVFDTTTSLAPPDGAGGARAPAPPARARWWSQQVAAHDEDEDPISTPRSPFLARIDVSPDGQRRLTLRVFCPRTGGTTPVETCETCGQAEEVQHTGPTEGSVICGLPGVSAADDAATSRFTVAEIARHGVASVHQAARQSVVWEILEREGARVVAVVDDEGLVRGWIRPSHRFAHVGAPVATAGDILTPAVAIEETVPAHLALRQMATSRLREILVVSVEGRPVGLLTDLDALRFVGAGRRPR